MIHHVTIRVRDLDRARAFYAAALAPLGYSVLMEFPGWAGLGVGRPELWLGKYEQTTPMHVALVADSEAKVRAFHAAALAAGGVDNGAPGPRPNYGPHYFGGFVLDPEGNNLEATLVPPAATAVAPKAAKKPAAKVAPKTAKKPAAKAAKKPAAKVAPKTAKKPAAKKPAKKSARR